MRFSNRAGIAVGIAVFSLTACNGGGSTPSPVSANAAAIPLVASPVTSASPTSTASIAPGTHASPTASPIAHATTTPTAHVTATPTASAVIAATSTPTNTAGITSSAGNGAGFSCNVGVYPIGSTVVSFGVQGNVSGSVFTPTSSTQLNSWFKSQVVLDIEPSISPLPTDSPVPEATITPTSTVTDYIYTGSYTVKNTNGSVDTNGCAIVEASANGTPIFSSSNAAAIGLPPIPDNATYATNNLASGTFSSFTLNNLSSNGGSGSFTLDNGETGTISLSNRSTYVLPVYLSADAITRQAKSLIRR